MYRALAKVKFIFSHYAKVLLPKLKDGKNWSWYTKHLLLVLPFYHIYGFGLLHMILLEGLVQYKTLFQYSFSATGIIMSKFDPIIFLSSLEKYNVCFVLYILIPIVD